MTLRWDKNIEEILPKEFPDLITKLDAVMQNGSYDIRSVYTALAALTESYREGMRSMFTKKDQFDSFLSSFDIIIQDLASKITRPIFEKAVEDQLKK